MNGQPLPLDVHSEKLEYKTKMIIQKIEEIDREIAENYAKSKQSRGATQQMYKQKCITLMQKKKMYEKQANVTMQHQAIIENVNMVRENIQNTIEMGQQMKQIVQEQKKEMEKVNMDEIEDLQDEMLDMQFEQQYVNDLISRNYNIEADERELDEEMRELDNDYFDRILQEQAQAPSVNRPAQQNLPSVQKDVQPGAAVPSYFKSVMDARSKNTNLKDQFQQQMQ